MQSSDFKRCVRKFLAHEGNSWSDYIFGEPDARSHHRDFSALQNQWAFQVDANGEWVTAAIAFVDQQNGRRSSQFEGSQTLNQNYFLKLTNDRGDYTPQIPDDDGR